MIQSPRLRAPVLFLPIAAVIVVTLLAYRAVDRSPASSAWLLHTQEVVATRAIDGWRLARPMGPFGLVPTIASLVSRNAPRPA